MKKDLDEEVVLPLNAGMDLDVVGFDVVEPGIRDLVKVLWKIGYRTVSSCAGHIDRHEPYPGVAIPIDSAADVTPLERLLWAVARYNLSLGRDGFLPEALRTWVILPVNTPSGFTVYLQPYDNNQNEVLEKVYELREASFGLACFIEDECVDIFGDD